MVKLIVGQKGKGKTKYLLNDVKEAVKTVDGNIVFVDKDTAHMFELDKKVRLINIKEYPVDNADSFVGFICGIISQDHDLEKLYVDGFLKTAYLVDKSVEDIEAVVEKLDKVSASYDTEICISLSLDENELTTGLKDKILVSL